MISRTTQILFILLMSLTLSGCPYHTPAFTAKVLDAETKEPIEGAVAVAVYHKAAMGLGAGQISSIINVREALTDKDGVFRIPYYTTLVFPFTWQTDATFIIYKPGYGNFPHQHTYPPGLDSPNQQIFFSAGIGEERLLNARVGGDWKFETKTLKTGIVELPKMKTREERIKAKPAPVGEQGDWKKQRMLIKTIREEWKNLYSQDPNGLYSVEGE